MKEKPKEVQSFYNSLENLKSLNIWNIQKELETIENLDVDWKNKIVVERKILTYNINNGRLINNAQTTDIKGNINKTEFTVKEIDHIKKRINQTENTFLISRYAHLIWQIEKHNDYAEISILNYIKTINKVKVNEVRELPILLSALFYISKKTKIGIVEIQKFTLNLTNEVPDWFKSSILDAILENNILSSEQLKNIAIDLPNWVENENPTSYFHNKITLNTGIKLYKKFNIPTKKLYELLSENEDLILNQHQKDNDFIKLQTLGDKAKYLREAGKNVEAESILKEYNRLKQTVKLGKFNWELGEKETELFNDYLKKSSEIILKLPTEKILAYFSINEDILVDPKENETYSKQTIKNSIQNLFSLSVFDINSNHKHLEESEKIIREINKN